ncbi:hypothetical protein Taro_036694, partial [Colocasia esculenta]|nr:hypothetical protein [Colocasia esculenta]
MSDQSTLTHETVRRMGFNVPLERDRMCRHDLLVFPPKHFCLFLYSEFEVNSGMQRGSVSKKPPAVVGTKRSNGQAGNQQMKKYRDGGYQQAPVNREPCKHCDKTSHRSEDCWKALGRCLRCGSQSHKISTCPHLLSQGVLRPVPKQQLGISLNKGTIPLKDTYTSNRSWPSLLYTKRLNHLMQQ